MLLAEVLSLHFFRPFPLASEEPLGRARVEGSEIYSDTFWAAGRPEAGLVPGCWGWETRREGKLPAPGLWEPLQLAKGTCEPQGPGEVHYCPRRAEGHVSQVDRPWPQGENQSSRSLRPAQSTLSEPRFSPLSRWNSSSCSPCILSCGAGGDS